MYARLQFAFALWFAIVVLLPLWLFAVLLTARAAELVQTARRWGTSNLHSQEHEDEATTNPALPRLCAALLSCILFASWLFKKVNSVFSCRRCWSTPSSTTAKNGKNYERPATSRCSTFVARVSFTASFTIGVLLVFSARIFDEPLERAFFEQYPPGVLEGKTVLITGANSGVGLETAQWAAHWGRAEVLYLGTRNKKKCEQAKGEILKAAGDEARRKQRQRAAELYYGAGRTSEDRKTPRRPTPAPRAQTTRLRCFEFDLLPFGRKRDARRIQRGWKNSLPPGAKIDILVNNAGFAAGTRHDAMYVSHKILQRALQEDNNPKLRTVTVASLTAFFCTPGLVETLRTAYSVWYFRWREWGLGAFLSSGGASADWGYDRAVFPADEITEAVFVPSAPPTAPMDGKKRSTSKFTTRQGARQWRSLADRYAYPRVKYWQMLGAEENEIAIGLAFVKTSINPDLMDSFVGLFMRQADIGALPIVKAMLVGDGAVKRAQEEVLLPDQEEGAEVVAGRDDPMLGTRDSSPQKIKEVEERDTLTTEVKTRSAAAANPDDVVLEHDVAGAAKEASSPGASALGSVLLAPVAGFVQQPVFTQIAPQFQSQLLALLERVAASEQLAAAAEVVASAVTGVYGRAKCIVLDKILAPARGPLAEFLNATVNKPKIKRRFTSVCVMHQLFVQDCFSEPGWWGTDQQYLEDSRARLEKYLQTFFSATSRSDGRDGTEAMLTSAEEDEDVVEVQARRRKELLDALEDDTG